MRTEITPTSPGDSRHSDSDSYCLILTQGGQMILAVAKFADPGTLICIYSRTFSGYWGGYKSPGINEIFHLR